MATTFGWFEEFWAAVTRLYESTLRVEANQKQSEERMKQLTERIDRSGKSWQERWPSLAVLLSLTSGDFRAGRETECEWDGFDLNRQYKHA